MSNIKDAFLNGKALIAFLTAGDPSLDKTVDYILAMEQAGADLIEIGIPFSDPTAEGVVIQEADIRALKAGMTTDGVFEIVEKVREKCKIPLVLMTYLNPVFHYGYERFFEKCEALSADGIIVPDLPFEEKKEVSEVAEKHGVDVVSMIAPTSKERIQMIAENAKGFLYVVSSMGVTGVRTNIETDLSSIMASIRQVTDLPAAVGFGISTPKQAREMAAVSNGAIVGSAIVKLIEKYGEDAQEPLKEYVREMKAAMRMQPD